MAAEKWGGARAGAGRPKGSKNIGLKEPRKQRQLRAHDDEWALIKRFEKIIKNGRMQECADAVSKLERRLCNSGIN